jgi:predicted component of type VI protein secretion system
MTPQNAERWRCIMRRYTLFLLVAILLVAFLLGCTSTPEPVVEEEVVEEVTEVVEAEEPVAETTEPEPAEEEAPVEVEVVEEEVATEPEPEAVEEALPLATWQAVGAELFYGGEQMLLPPELLAYDVFVELYENEFAILLVPEVEFAIFAIYEFRGEYVVVSPLIYDNVPELLEEIVADIGAPLPTEFWFRPAVMGELGVLEAEALGLQLVTYWQ